MTLCKLLAMFEHYMTYMAAARLSGLQHGLCHFCVCCVCAADVDLVSVRRVHPNVQDLGTCFYGLFQVVV